MTVRSAVTVGVVCALIGTILVARVLQLHGWDPTYLIAFGEEAPEITAYAEDRLGPVTTRPAQGHDGKFFFVQANDPLLLAPSQNAAVLDRPAYRSQRMLYPLLAGGGGAFSPQVILWSMTLFNVMALGLGSWATAHIATSLGRSPWWGLAFGMNLGLLGELMIGGAGLIAMMYAVFGIWAVLAGRMGSAVFALVASVLAREAMLLVAGGVALWLWLQRRRGEAVSVAGLPALAAAGWALYVGARLGSTGESGIQELGWPFVGIVEAASDWGSRPVSRVVGPIVLLLLLRFAWHVVQHRTLTGLATVGFVPLALVLSYQVWLGYGDITRAVAPALTGYVLSVFVEGSDGATEDVKAP